MQDTCRFVLKIFSALFLLSWKSSLLITRVVDNGGTAKVSEEIVDPNSYSILVFLVCAFCIEIYFYMHWYRRSCIICWLRWIYPWCKVGAGSRDFIEKIFDPFIRNFDNRLNSNKLKKERKSCNKDNDYLFNVRTMFNFYPMYSADIKIPWLEVTREKFSKK